MSDSPRPFTVQRDHGLAVVRFVVRDLDPAQVERIGVEVPALIAHDPRPQLVLDLSELSYLPTRILGVLVEMHHRVQALGGNMRICGLKPLPREVFITMRLDRVLHLCANLDEARASLLGCK